MRVPRAHAVRQSCLAVAKVYLLIAGIIALGPGTAFAAAVNFFQITDPHIFDCKGETEGNKEALKWCISEINRRVEENPESKFIVVTGDLGLEGLPCGGSKSEPGASVERAQELAEIIKESKVKKWLFLPGNNDLVGEDPANIGTFHRFIQALQAQLPEVVNFSPRQEDKTSGLLDLGGCRFIGFNNASFKSNDSGSDAERFKASQLENVNEVRARLKPEEGFKHAYIFYHVPEIEDPYYAGMDPTDQKLIDRESKRGQNAKDAPLSAWTVVPEVRKNWNEIVAKEKVKGLFAAHFHSWKHDSYDGLAWVKNREYAAASLPKLYVCPPVASKKQEKEPEQARGFREVSIDCDTGSITSNIIWYEPTSAPFKIVEKDLTLSVDPANNTASGLFHLSNNTEKEIPLSLSADDFKSKAGGYGLNAKVLFALPSPSPAGQPVLATTLPPLGTLAVKVDVSSFWEAGEATADLRNYGEPFGKLRAVKWRPPFGVKIMAPVPDKPEFSFTKDSKGQITLKNEDAMTYVVALTVEVDGIRSEPRSVKLSPHSSASVEVSPPPKWFPASAAVKEIVRDGNIRYKWEVANTGGQPVPERVVPFKAHLNSLGEFWQSSLGYVFVLLFVTLGGACSMILSNWVPNRLSRAGVEEQLGDLARKTASLSTRIDSGLRVFLRVERNRLQRLLQSYWIFSANFPDIVKRVGDYIAGLSKQIDLAGKLDRARETLQPLLQTNPIPVKIEQIDRELQKAADLLRRCDCSAEDLDAAKVLITQANERISKMDQTDEELVGELRSRIEALKTYVQPGTEPERVNELKQVFQKTFGRFDPAVAEKIDPKQYSPVDFLATQLELLRQYQAYYETNPQPPNLPKPEEARKFLDAETFGSLQRARLLLREIREGIYVDRIETALDRKQAEIVVEPLPVEDQLLRFSVRFHAEELNGAAACEELRCEWDFGDGTVKENGWEAYHYFRPPPDRKLWERVRRARPWRKPESQKFKITATFSKKNPDPSETTLKQITFSKDDLLVREAHGNPGADRNLAEGVRLAIALVIALIGLLAGAREQLTKLDLIPAAIAVFLLGFGADTIKNLLTPKQAPKPPAA